MTRLNIAQVVHCTEAEGPGRRFAVWFQGCPLRCAGCCNPEMLPFEGGAQTTVIELTEAIRQAREREQVEGVSLLGGEPFAHLPGSAELASECRAIGLSVMVYSGHTLSELQVLDGAATLLSVTDVLVDGPYLRDQPETRRRWVGSANQKVHFFTNRYSANDPCWARSNSLELRMRNNVLSVNGFPAPAAVGLWRRPKLLGTS